MAPVNPVPSDSSSDVSGPPAGAAPGPSRAALQDNPLAESSAGAAGPEPVTQEELNAWRRGFTPQAEIWNGRLAMLGLSVGLGVLLLVRLVAGRG